jgi:hypothetical protein
MKRTIHIAVMAIAAAALTGQAHAQVRDADGWLALQEPGMSAFSHPNGSPSTYSGYRSSTESHAGMVMTASKPAPKKRIERQANHRSARRR